MMLLLLIIFMDMEILNLPFLSTDKIIDCIDYVYNLVVYTIYDKIKFSTARGPKFSTARGPKFSTVHTGHVENSGLCAVENLGHNSSGHSEMFQCKLFYQ